MKLVDLKTDIFYIKLRSGFASSCIFAFTGNLGVNHQTGSNKGAELRASSNGLLLLPDRRSFYSTGKYSLCPELNLP